MPRPCWRGDELRALREHAGKALRDDGRHLSQFQLAEEIRASERVVRAWEANDQILISPALITSLNIFAERVGFRRSVDGGDDMRRSVFVAGGGSLVAAQLLPAPGRAIDEAYVAGLADEATSLEGRYSTGPIVQLMDSAAGHYHWCVSLLDHTRTHAAHQRLQVVAGATALLVGILARDVGLWAWSRRYTNTALDFAEEAEHGGLEARARSALGILYDPLLGDGAHADVRRFVEEAEGARSLAQRYSPPAMRSFASAELGLAYAAGGRRIETRKALSQAGKDLGGDGAVDDLGARFVGTMNETVIAVYTGRGLLALGDTRPAIRELEGALRGGLSPIHTVSTMIALSGAYKHTGDRQREASLLAQARAAAVRHRYLLGLQRIEVIRQQA